MAWEFATENGFEEQLTWAREFVRDEVVPFETRDIDESDLESLSADVRERGLWAPELSAVHLCLLHEAVGWSERGPIVFGLEDASVAFAVTEPGAGSDVSLAATSASRDGDTWVINGRKSYVANASVATVLRVFAVTNPDVHFSQGTSILDVPVTTPGVAVSGDDIVFTDARVPYDSVVGAEGDGFALVQEWLDPIRLHHVMQWLGQAERAFDMLCERAVSRFTHGSVLADKQTVQNWIADSKAEIAAGRLLALQAAWTIDSCGLAEASPHIAMCQFVAASAFQNTVDRAIQVHGALGLSEAMPLTRMYRAARAARIVDGPDEVHRVTVARTILRDYKPVEVPTELRVHDGAFGESDRESA